MLAAALACTLALGACGKKPKDVTPPPGASQNVYPNPALDPKGGQPQPGEIAPGIRFP
jgi:hypothetical protein